MDIRGSPMTRLHGSGSRGNAKRPAVTRSSSGCWVGSDRSRWASQICACGVERAPGATDVGYRGRVSAPEPVGPGLAARSLELRIDSTVSVPATSMAARTTRLPTSKVRRVSALAERIRGWAGGPARSPVRSLAHAVGSVR